MTERNPIPDLCGGRSLSDLILKRVENTVSYDFVGEFLRQGRNSIFLAFDGYDEEYYHCKDRGLMEEASRDVNGCHNNIYDSFVLPGDRI